MYEAYKEMSRAVGVKKPQEAQKAKALWKMKAAKQAGEEAIEVEQEKQGKIEKPEPKRSHSALQASDLFLQCGATFFVVPSFEEKERLFRHLS